ncbi:hypothetical protein J3Q07_08330 [Pseudomonas sp. D4-18]|uniref:hypothetical protein n=1 Tax=Pseudomonas sp. D4-18 TaxID=2817395 RepID=UPI003DA9D369
MKHTITIDIGVDVVDIPTMQSMDALEYSAYISNSLLWVDHHDVLRANHGDYSVATTSAQVELLIDHLKDIAQSMRRAGV